MCLNRPISSSLTVIEQMTKQSATLRQIDHSITPSISTLPGLQDTVQGQFAGLPPTFCSQSCRQRAYEQRRWSPLHPMELLAWDIDTARVRNVIGRRCAKLCLQPVLSSRLVAS